MRKSALTFRKECKIPEENQKKMKITLLNQVKENL